MHPLRDAIATQIDDFHDRLALKVDVLEVVVVGGGGEAQKCGRAQTHGEPLAGALNLVERRKGDIDFQPTTYRV